MSGTGHGIQTETGLMTNQKPEALYQPTRWSIDEIGITVATTTLIKFSGLGLAFLTSLLIARMAGPEHFGAWIFAISLATLVAIPASLGLPQLLVRETAKHPARTQSYLFYSFKQLSWSSALAFALMCILSQGQNDPLLAHTVLMAALLPPFINLGAALQSLLQGNERVVSSVWPLLLLAPLLILIICGAFYLAVGLVDSRHAILGSIFSSFIACIVLLLLLRKSVAAPMFQRSQQHIGLSLRQSLPFIWIVGFYLALGKTDILMLGAIMGAEEAGKYAIASRATELIPIASYAVYMALAPRMTKFLSLQKFEELQMLLDRLRIPLLTLSLPFFALFIIIPEQVIVFTFGSAFAEAATVLRILSVYGIIVVLFGPTGTLLNISGNETPHLFLAAFCLALNVVLNFILIHHAGAVGAAIATVVSILFFKIGLLILVRVRLGVRPSLFGV